MVLCAQRGVHKRREKERSWLKWWDRGARGRDVPHGQLFMGSQHPSPNVKNLLRIRAANWLEIITSRDAKSTCFQGSQTSCPEIISGVFFAKIWPKRITSRDGCVLLNYEGILMAKWNWELTCANAVTSRSRTICSKRFRISSLGRVKRAVPERAQGKTPRNSLRIPWKDPENAWKQLKTPWKYPENTPKITWKHPENTLSPMPFVEGHKGQEKNPKNFSPKLSLGVAVMLLFATFGATPRVTSKAWALLSLLWILDGSAVREKKQKKKNLFQNVPRIHTNRLKPAILFF